MAKIHDLFIIELAEVIKGYGNDPDVEDPFRLSEFYRFYELPNIAVSRENFEKMRPAQPEIIRCKDCRFATLTYDGDCKYCQYLEGEFGLTDAVYFDGNDYCSHAERRTDG